MWPGWLSVGGVEVINTARTEKYAETAGLGFFRPVYRNDALGDLLNQHYASPLQDNAPWVDHYDPDSYEFFGAYPLAVDGFDDSTYGAAVVESTLDGGTVGRTRAATRALTFSVALIAASDCGAAYGMNWLTTALAGAACAPTANSACAALDCSFLFCAPSISPAMLSSRADLLACLESYQRHLYGVGLVTGPTITQKMDMDDGSVWTATFTLVAGNPFVYGTETPLVTGFMDPGVFVPYPGGIVPEGGSFDADGSQYIEADPCVDPHVQPVMDPLCPNLAVPPSTPSVSIACFTMPGTVVRRSFTVPASMVPTWGEVAPLIRVNARDAEVRTLRVRFYADPRGLGSPDPADPCSYCGDIVFSYIPHGSVLVFDGVLRSIYLESVGGVRRRADALVFRSDGTPFEWPELTCGMGYVVTVDLPQSSAPPILDLTLTSKGGGNIGLRYPVAA